MLAGLTAHDAKELPVGEIALLCHAHWTCCLRPFVDWMKGDTWESSVERMEYDSRVHSPPPSKCSPHVM